MSGVTKSLALTSLFPETVTRVDALEKTLRWLKANHAFTSVEYFTAPGRDERIRRVLEELGFESAFIAVLPLKAAGFSLCAVDEDERGRAVEVLKACIDRAGAAGARRIMVNSGFIPECAALVEAGCDSYARSILEAARHIERRKLPLRIELEPGDSHVQSRQLLGPTDRVLETTRRILKETGLYTLVMDVAHIREEGEPVMDALRAAKPWCNHIHLCNCVMDDPAHPLYGDKHVDFDQEGACFTYGDFERMFGEIKRLYAGEELIVALEITCREADNFAWFDRVAARCAWLFQ